MTVTSGGQGLDPERPAGQWPAVHGRAGDAPAGRRGPFEELAAVAPGRTARHEGAENGHAAGNRLQRRQPRPRQPAFFGGAGGKEDPVGDGGEKPGGHQFALAGDEDSDPGLRAVPDDVVDKVLGPGLGAGADR